MVTVCNQRQSRCVSVAYRHTPKLPMQHNYNAAFIKRRYIFAYLFTLWRGLSSSHAFRSRDLPRYQFAYFFSSTACSFNPPQHNIECHLTYLDLILLTYSEQTTTGRGSRRRISITWLAYLPSWGACLATHFSHVTYLDSIFSLTPWVHPSTI